MKPTEQQIIAMTLAMSEGYIRPASPTHAKRCHTTTGRLDATCKALVRHGLMRSLSGFRYALTPEGEALIPSSPAPTRTADDARWAF